MVKGNYLTLPRPTCQLALTDWHCHDADASFYACRSLCVLSLPSLNWTYHLVYFWMSLWVLLNNAFSETLTLFVEVENLRTLFWHQLCSNKVGAGQFWPWSFVLDKSGPQGQTNSSRIYAKNRFSKLLKAIFPQFTRLLGVICIGKSFHKSCVPPD